MADAYRRAAASNAYSVGAKAVLVNYVGTHTPPDGGYATYWKHDINYPTGQKALLRALHLADNPAGKAALGAFIDQCLRARPHYLDQALKRQTRNRPGNVEYEHIMNAITTNDPVARAAIRDGNLADGHTKAMIYGSFMWYISQRLNANAATRENNNQRNHTLVASPAHMVSFETEHQLHFNSGADNIGSDRYWRLMHYIVMYVNKQFNNSNTFDLNNPNKTGELLTFLRTWRTDNQVEGGAEPVIDRHRKFTCVLTRRPDQETVIQYDEPLAGQVAPADFDDFKTTLAERFEIDANTTTIDTIWFRSNQGGMEEVRDDTDYQRHVDLASANIDVHIYHSRIVPGGNWEDPTWIPHAAHIFGNEPGGCQQKSYQEGHTPRDSDWTNGMKEVVRGLAQGQKQNMMEELSAETRAAAARFTKSMKANDPAAVAHAGCTQYDTLMSARVINSEAIRNMRSKRHAKYSNIDRVREGLDALTTIGQNTTRLHRQLPNKRFDVDGVAVPGMKLSPAQRSALLFMFDMEQTKKGCMVADDPGIGKTGMMIAHILLSEWRMVNGPAGAMDNLPRIVFAPSALVPQIVEDLANDLGQGWHVLRVGKHRQVTLPDQPIEEFGLSPGQGRSVFDRIDATVPVRRHVVVISDNAASRQKRNTLLGEFSYKYVDEAHEYRRAQDTAKGLFNLSVKATRGTFLFTGTPIVNSIRDMLGYVALMERPEFRLGQNLNRTTGDQAARQRYCEWDDYAQDLRRQAGVALPQGHSDTALPHGARRNEPPNWNPQTTQTINGVTISPNMTRPECLLVAGRVTDWPANEFWNTRFRTASLNEEDRYVKTKVKARFAAANEEVFDDPEDSDASDDSDDGDVPAYVKLPVFHLHHALNANRWKCHTVAAFNYWIGRHIDLWEQQPQLNVASLEIATERLGKIWSDTVLQRQHDSEMVDDLGEVYRITEDIAEMEVERRDLVFNERGANAYRAAAAELNQRVEFEFGDEHDTMGEAYPRLLLEDGDHDRADEDAEPLIDDKRGSSYNQLTNLCTHPAFHKFRQRTTKQWERMADQTLPYLLWEMRVLRTCGLDTANMLWTDEAILRDFLDCSPKFCQMLLDIWRIVESGSEKNHVMVVVQFPRVAMWIEKLLNFCGIANIRLKSGDNADGRFQKITKQFNTRGGPKVLIAPFTLKLAGFNLHYFCHNVLVLDQPYNIAVFEQAVKRVHRKGQLDKQYVMRYHMPHTFMAIVEERIISKAVGAHLISAAGLREEMQGRGWEWGREMCMNMVLNMTGAVEGRERSRG